MVLRKFCVHFLIFTCLLSIGMSEMNDSLNIEKEKLQYSVVRLLSTIEGVNCILFYGDASVDLANITVPVVTAYKINPDTNICPHILATFDSFEKAMILSESAYQTNFMTRGIMIIIIDGPTLEAGQLSTLFSLMWRVRRLSLVTRHSTNGQWLLHGHDVTLKEGSFVLRDVYSEKDGQFTKGGVDIFTDKKVKNFGGRQIKVVSFDYAPFTTTREGGQNVFNGIEV